MKYIKVGRLDFIPQTALHVAKKTNGLSKLQVWIASRSIIYRSLRACITATQQVINCHLKFCSKKKPNYCNLSKIENSERLAANGNANWPICQLSDYLNVALYYSLLDYSSLFVKNCAIFIKK
jgi:hypothetical protein